VFSSYVDELMIPQLKELRGDYGVDGVWIDGECWAVTPDYSERALQAFKQATGIAEVPRKPGESPLARVSGVQPRGIPPLRAPLRG